MNPNQPTGMTLDLEHIFTYHAPSEDQQRRYLLLRDMAKSFAATILSCTPAGPDQSTAIRKVREAVMTANAAIALEKKP